MIENQLVETHYTVTNLGETILSAPPKYGQGPKFANPLRSSSGGRIPYPREGVYPRVGSTGETGSQHLGPGCG